MEKKRKKEGTFEKSAKKEASLFYIAENLKKISEDIKKTPLSAKDNQVFDSEDNVLVSNLKEYIRNLEQIKENEYEFQFKKSPMETFPYALLDAVYYTSVVYLSFLLLKEDFPFTKKNVLITFLISHIVKEFAPFVLKKTPLKSIELKTDREDRKLKNARERFEIIDEIIKKLRELEMETLRLEVETLRKKTK